MPAISALNVHNRCYILPPKYNGRDNNNNIETNSHRLATSKKPKPIKITGQSVIHFYPYVGARNSFMAVKERMGRAVLLYCTKHMEQWSNLACISSDETMLVSS